MLSEGSKMVLVALQSRFDQGVYGLVSNLGSLVVRALFQPLEEVAFTAFSRSARLATARRSHAAFLVEGYVCPDVCLWKACYFLGLFQVSSVLEFHAFAFPPNGPFKCFGPRPLPPSLPGSRLSAATRLLLAATWPTPSPSWSSWCLCWACWL